MSLDKHIVIASIMPEKGGSGLQTYVNCFKEFLNKRNIAATLVTPFSYLSFVVLPVFAVRKAIDLFYDEGSVWWYEKWHYFFLKKALAKQLEKQASKQTATVIFAQDRLSAKAALESRRTPGQKVILVVHFNVSEADEWVGLGKIKYEGRYYQSIKSLERTMLPSLDGIIYVSKFMQRTIERSIPQINSARAVCIPCFTSRPCIDKIDDGNVLGDLITIGSLDIRKNQSYLLQVLACAKRKGYRYSLTFVGDGAERNNLQKLAHTLGLTQQVRFLGYQKNASQFLRAHRVYVHSALIENLPISLLEALASNLPIIAGAVGGIPEIFSDGVEGYYWPLDDPETGADILINLNENEDLYKEISLAAERRFNSHFKTEQVAGEILSFLQSQLA